MAEEKVPWDLVSVVRRSKRKKQIITELAEEPACPSELAQRYELQTGSMANIFRELKKTEPPLIKCLTPEQPHHRIYGLTEVGEIVYQHI